MKTMPTEDFKGASEKLHLLALDYRTARTYEETDAAFRALDKFVLALLAELDRVRGERDALRNGNTELLEALMDMVLQHCGGYPDDLIRHNYLSANEDAVSILEQAGMIENDRLYWSALQRRKDAARGKGEEGG
jgi:hypothetical protein